MSELPKKTPRDATEFEREQLRFFLAKDNVAAVLTDLNPSLAWLPVLAELKLIAAETRLASWIEKNFADVDAIREVTANIHFFDAGTADVLEFRLNRTKELPSLLVKCWRLIIRHMRTTKRGALRDEWFDIEPRIRRGEHSPELLERLAHALRPKLQIGKRLSWSDDEGTREPEWPADLMSIDYEVEAGVTEEEVLSAWPADAPPNVDEKLLGLLSHSLGATLEDAIEVGVESNWGYGLSDMDVPSVAKHNQNAHRTGLLPIVRVMADVWTRLAQKDAQRAATFVDLWRASSFRLLRRLAAYAAADPTVPAGVAAEILMTLPRGELFLTNSSVEVYRLIDARWQALEPDKQRAIETRIAEGPPADWFREDEDRAVNRCRFDLLGHLKRGGVQLSAHAEAMLDNIRKQWPEWELRPEEQAGFHMWHGAGFVVGDPAKFSGVPDDQLISAAKKAADDADFLEGDAWQALCQSDAPRALRGLDVQAGASHWPISAWHSFLWAAPKLQDVEGVRRVAQLLLNWPAESFPEIAGDASWWLNKSAKTLDESLLWPLWDRVAEAVSQKVEAPNER